MSLAQRWTALLDQLRVEGRQRRLTLPRGVDFASNDYLGYGNCQDEPERGESLARSGQASRLLRGHHAIWDEVEARLARWHGAEAALVFNSGYVANEGLLATIVEPGDWVASDQLNHASIIDGLRLARAERFVFRHNDLDHLASGLHAAAQARPAGRQLFVVTESLFGMDGDTAPLEQLVPLVERHDACLIVDEAHATGCFGPGGSGLIDAAGLRSRVHASVHTGGKALGAVGAYVCGSRLLTKLLINRCRQFIFTTALPPVVGAWWLQALDRVQSDEAGRRRLHAAAQLFREELARQGVPALGGHYLVPVVLGGDVPTVEAAQALQEAGWDIRAIRPPSVPVGTARLRIALHADHEAATLRAAAAAVAAVCQRGSSQPSAPRTYLP